MASSSSPSDEDGFATPAAATVSLALAIIVTAVMIRSATELRRARADFERTRAETPGLYESYADLEAGVWTRLRIVVSGAQAKLYINGSDQPSLIVNDLKLGQLRGKVALWSGRDADGYFSNLRVY